MWVNKAARQADQRQTTHRFKQNKNNMKDLVTTCQETRPQEAWGPHWWLPSPPRWQWSWSELRAAPESSHLLLCPHLCSPWLSYPAGYMAYCRWTKRPSKIILFFFKINNTKHSIGCYLKRTVWSYTSTQRRMKRCGLRYLLFSPISWTPLSSRELAERPCFITCNTQKKKSHLQMGLLCVLWIHTNHLTI